MSWPVRAQTGDKEVVGQPKLLDLALTVAVSANQLPACGAGNCQMGRKVTTSWRGRGNMSRMCPSDASWMTICLECLV